jgi:penicillin-binding protein 1A
VLGLRQYVVSGRSRIMGWFSRQRSGSPDSGFGSVPPPLPQPFQALSDFAFRPSSTLLNHAAPARPAPRRGFIRRLLGRLPLKIRILLALPAAGALALAASLLTMMIYYTVTFPHPLAMRGKERAPVIRILARDGSVLAERGAAADYMPLDLLPRHVRGAVVATEDRRADS